MSGHRARTLGAGRGGVGGGGGTTLPVLLLPNTGQLDLGGARAFSVRTSESFAHEGVFMCVCVCVFRIVAYVCVSRWV